MYFVVFGVFHVGLAPYWIFGGDPQLTRVEDYAWFAGPLGLAALWLVIYAMCAYLVGAFLASIPRVSSPRVVKDASGRSERLAKLGEILLVVGVALWLYRVVSSGGLGLLVGSYESFLSGTALGGLSLAYPLIGIGLGFSMLATKLKDVRIGVVAFCGFAVIAFFVGLRGEVLFPIAVASCVRATRVQMPKLKAIALVLVVALAVISGAQSVRAAGVAAYEPRLSDFNPAAAVAELGSTIRVVVYTLAWHDAGEPYREGDTYTVAVARLIEGVASPATRPDAASDFRLFNSEIASRAGNIGGSTVGEAYHNFGVAGVLVIPLLLGVLMGVFGRQSSYLRMALFVCVAVPLFNHVRNSFVPVIPAVVGALILLGILSILQNRGRLNRAVVT